MKELWVVFATVFLAELGDKTQVATLLFATKPHLTKLGVFAAASLALMASSLLAVALGGVIEHWLSAGKIRWIAGLGFIAVGVWTLVKPG